MHYNKSFQYFINSQLLLITPSILLDLDSANIFACFNRKIVLKSSKFLI